MLSASDRLLIDGFQRDFPIEPEPFRAVADRLGLDESDVLASLIRLSEIGVISRLGAVLRPNSAGASTLAAIAAPAEKLEAIAEAINAEPGVNHNYEREHALNLWFVVTGPTREAIAASLGRIESRVGLTALDFPLLRAFHIDLGFPIFTTEALSKNIARRADPPPPEPDDLRLLTAIEDGLPLRRRPYRDVARRLGWREQEIIFRLRRLIAAGTIARFGLVVRHHSLGFRANAMVVWDIDDSALPEIGLRLAAAPGVTLCYERPRRPPFWRYNLYSMIHGRDRDQVRSEIGVLADSVGPASRGHDILFSRRCFRQRGAKLSAA
ncbi:siroheme decarboxylase subunit beta [Rhodoblastus sp.]|uniref:siroheme decarboxylase subunit beta n=1 Tax=Rhodoblastus sp. TaxID=1962975 RepID=UPI003F9B4C9B